MTRKQEAMDTMGQILQTNPALWSVAGDLFVKNMDWPGAETMAKRFEKMLDPKVLQDTDESPEAQVMRQQMEQMAQAMEQTTAQIQQLMQSYEMQKLAIDEQNSQIKAYEAETKRIQVTQPAMTPEQIQDIVQGTIAAALDMGDIVPNSPPMQTLPEFEQ
jgi:heterodisulfide reductase subunit A-like polyferredoxin